MVRTRNTRQGAASPGKESSSFKPTTNGNRKGRKRQLTESSAGSVRCTVDDIVRQPSHQGRARPSRPPWARCRARATDRRMPGWPCCSPQWSPAWSPAITVSTCSTSRGCGGRTCTCTWSRPEQSGFGTARRRSRGELPVLLLMSLLQYLWHEIQWCSSPLKIWQLWR